MVSSAESFKNRNIRVRNLQEAIVGDHNEGVDFFAQLFHTCIRLRSTAISFEGEGTSDDTDGQCTRGARNLCNDGGSARTGTAAFTRGHEDHVCPLEGFGDFLNVVFGRLATDRGICTGAEAVREIATDIKLGFCIGHEQSLRVRVHGDKFNALQAHFNHSIDGVHTATTDSDDLNNRQMILRCDHNPALFLRTNLKPQVEG